MARIALNGLSPQRIGLMAAATMLMLAAHAATQPLERLLAEVLRNGLDAQLPAHLSVVLGISRVEQTTAVKQAVIRQGSLVKTFNVSNARHEDVVILTYDEQNKSTHAYLMSSAGALRKAVSYQAGGAPNDRPLADARGDFALELKFWTAFANHPTRASPN